MPTAPYIQGTSPKRPHFNKTHNHGEEGGLIELQNKLGYQFKDKEILKRALKDKEKEKEEDDGVLIMLGKNIMQTCVYYECLKKNTMIPKAKLQKRLENFWKRKEYGVEARRLNLSAYVGSGNENKFQLKNLEAKCYAAVIGAIALDTTIDNAVSVFHTLRKRND
ncbi:protein NUCLEAR FUSION DEFECTIVE 2 [Cryptomeria japonica]|uniref:protein NUCLEAR FUSION DEFECTIVE 2 n=1 Tax=Cryptomeria japonica TaxID=3369 RepID=UPI0025ABEF0C|nr:protein NUCLEAR FUSION DEFECTIVE 2 [Cryptomeria japonica]